MWIGPDNRRIVKKKMFPSHHNLTVHFTMSFYGVSRFITWRCFTLLSDLTSRIMGQDLRSLHQADMYNWKQDWKMIWGVSACSWLSGKFDLWGSAVMEKSGTKISQTFLCRGCSHRKERDCLWQYGLFSLENKDQMSDSNLFSSIPQKAYGNTVDLAEEPLKQNHSMWYRYQESKKNLFMFFSCSLRRVNTDSH